VIANRMLSRGNKVANRTNLLRRMSLVLVFGVRRETGKE